MFIKQKGHVVTKMNPLDEDDQSIGDGSSDTGTHSQYRPNYPVNFDPHVLEDNFFKSLESKFSYCKFNSWTSFFVFKIKPMDLILKLVNINIIYNKY